MGNLTDWDGTVRHSILRGVSAPGTDPGTPSGTAGLGPEGRCGRAREAMPEDEEISTHSGEDPSGRLDATLGLPGLTWLMAVAAIVESPRRTAATADEYRPPTKVGAQVSNLTIGRPAARIRRLRLPLIPPGHE